MKVYDISQEVFNGQVYPGDPKPYKEQVMKLSNGDMCNLTKFEMCAHNGTHLDAPYHFFDNGKTVENLNLTKCIGTAHVIERDGLLTRKDIDQIMDHSKKKIILKGPCVITEEAAVRLVEYGAELIGTQSQSVGPLDHPEAVHKILLEREVVLLEGLVLNDVPEGVYFLSAVPLKLSGSDGAPVRAVLLPLQDLV